MQKIILQEIINEKFPNWVKDINLPLKKFSKHQTGITQRNAHPGTSQNLLKTKDQKKKKITTAREK